MMALRAPALSAIALLWSGAGVAHAGMTPVYEAGDATQAPAVAQTIPDAIPAASTKFYPEPTSFEPVATVPMQVTAYAASQPVPISTFSPEPASSYLVTEQNTSAPIMRLSNDATQLYELVLRPDVTTAINFQGSERITTVLMGRAEEFFVDTPKNRQTISVRPKTAQSKSNMTVVTNRDIYHFDLAAVSLHGGGSPVYGVVVDDRDAIARAERNSLGDLTDLNFGYTFRGSDDLRPVRLFDDGKHTYFQFPQHTAQPAVFAVGPDGKEAIVNHHVKGNYLVVESLRRQFTLRRGSTFICIYNKAYPKTLFGDQAPQPEGDT